MVPESPNAITPTDDGLALQGAARTSPGAGEVRLAVTAALLTGLERAAANGAGGFRGVPGHAFAGVVEAVGPEVDASWTGARAVPAPMAWCGRCDRCRGGLREHCPDRTVLGLERRDGGLGSHAIVPAASLTRIPNDMDDAVAVFAAPLGSALAARRQIPTASRGFVTVLGDGTMGMLIAQVLAPVNGSVRLIGRSSEKLGLCERWSIKHRHVDDIGRRADQDVVIECTGREEGLELAARLCRPRGTIVLKSIVPPTRQLAPGVRLDPVVLGERIILGSFLGPIDEAMRLLAGGAIDVLPLIEQRIRLDAAVRLLSGPRRPGSRASLVLP
jgi:threonine dehydrogenase-like Zn-dependent dehydrogenase